MVTNNQKDVDLMLGDPKKAVVAMAIPLMFAYLVTTTQSFVDGFWCSGLGSESLSAIAISSTVYMTVMMLGQGMGLGASTAISRALGAGNRDYANKVCSHAFLIGILMSILATCFVLSMSRPILGFIANDGDIDKAMEYLLPFAIFSLPLTMSGIFTGLLRGEGAARKSMVFSAGSAIFNMVLDPVFIYVLGFGLTGAALSTVASFGIMEIVVLYWYRTGRMYLSPYLRGLRPDTDVLRDISSVGLPQTIQLIVVPILMTPENSFVVRCGGADGLMVFNYSFMFNSIAMIPAQALFASMVPIASANVGQKDATKLRKTFTFTGKLALLITVSIMLVVVSLSPWLVLVFTHSGDMVSYHDQMAHALSILAFYIPMACMATFGSNILIILKHAKISSTMSIVRELLFLGFFYVCSSISMDAIFYSCIVVNTINMSIILPLARHFFKKEEKTGFVNIA